MRSAKTHLSNVFISYAHKDNEGCDPNTRWLDRLLEHLKPLAYTGVVTAWSDHDIKIGDNWHEKIRTSLTTARIAILLVSPAFLASEYIRNSELPVLLKRAKEQGVIILSIILRPSLFRTTLFKYPDPINGPEEFSLAQLQASNPPNKTLSEMDGAEQDRILLTVAERIQEILQQDHKNTIIDLSDAPIDDRDKASQSSIKSHADPNREKMLKRVQRDWIEGLLNQSLYHIARMDVGLERKPEAVQERIVVHQPAQSSQNIPVGTRISTVFDDLSQGLLILGAPGAGKTTLLLELARDLLDRAAQDPVFPMPVIFSLSTWAEKREAFNHWMVGELNKRYDVPRRLAQEWVDREQIVPLLDGLDEVAVECRGECIEAINEFRAERGFTPIAVCSRTEDYEALAERLRLPGAVAIQPLSRQQVDGYFMQAGEPLAGIRAALQKDDTLWQLLENPLMLSVASIAYQGLSAEQVLLEDSIEERRKQLLSTYVDVMFERPGRAKPSTQSLSYTRKQTMEWLAWLAAGMMRRSETILYLGWMQPDWLRTHFERRMYRTGVGISCALASSLIVWLVIGLFHCLTNVLIDQWRSSLVDEMVFELSSTLNVLSIVGLILGLSASIRRPRNGGLIFFLIFCLVFGLASFLEEGLLASLMVIIYFGPFLVLIGVLAVKAVGYSGTIRPVETLSWSLESAKRSLGRALRHGLIGGPIIGLLAGAYLGGIQVWFLSKFGFRLGHGILVPLFYKALIAGLIGGLLYGLLYGVLYGLFGGFSSNQVASRAFPNQEIKRSFKKGVTASLGIGLGSGLMSKAIFIITSLLGLEEVFSLQIHNLIYGLDTSLTVGLISGLIGGLHFGGLAAFQHYTVCMILWLKHYAPLNYVSFLDHASDLIFLRKLEGGYMFVHRMILEHFASLNMLERKIVWTKSFLNPRQSRNQ